MVALQVARSFVGRDVDPRWPYGFVRILRRVADGIAYGRLGCLGRKILRKPVVRIPQCGLGYAR
jgi:hypothetical protein